MAYNAIVFIFTTHCQSYYGREMNTKKAASVLGKLGRKRNSPAQAEASRKNGKLGGRPKISQNSSCITQAPRIISPQTTQ